MMAAAICATGVPLAFPAGRPCDRLEPGRAAGEVMAQTKPWTRENIAPAAHQRAFTPFATLIGVNLPTPAYQPDVQQKQQPSQRRVPRFSQPSRCDSLRDQPVARSRPRRARRLEASLPASTSSPTGPAPKTSPASALAAEVFALGESRGALSSPARIFGRDAAFACGGRACAEGLGDSTICALTKSIYVLPVTPGGYGKPQACSDFRVAEFV
jgi:hypothetical protein